MTDKAIAVIDQHLRNDSAAFAAREMHAAQMEALERRCMELERDKAQMQCEKLQAEMATLRASSIDSAEACARLDALEAQCATLYSDIEALKSRPASATPATLDPSLANRITALEMTQLKTVGPGGNYRAEFVRGGDGRIQVVRMPDRGMTIEVQRDGADQMIGAIISSE